ncbi:hypothetical protein [Peribacillus sp. TH24]|uniref:hypothetical protein n=1 Tax=Peribacillus sp. TH24 TaxID=2798483 RepID=UPI00191480D2|nr:hypothetical protein [Peribacillus sp. TH24]MBK5445341.1 hypothetical protein [Peribacillus sp. TH24]
MNLIKYFGIQFILFTGIILTGSYSDSYISDPYFYTDLITIFNLKMDGLEHLKKFLVNTKVNPEQYIVNGWKMESPSVCIRTVIIQMVLLNIENINRWVDNE